MSDDLPLFHWRPSRKVLFFPLQKRAGKIRHTASRLFDKHGDDAVLYWKQVLAGLRKHFQHIGLSEDEAHAETVAFEDAVRREMNRLALAQSQSGGGDAA